MFGGRSEAPPRSVPRLLSLEIFNPETDDMDSDSSGLSSPDSVGSVISIKNEEDNSNDNANQNTKEQKSVDQPVGGATGTAPKTEKSDDCMELKLELEEPKSENNVIGTRLSPLLEAAADVANTLEETVDAVIQSSPQAKRKQYPLKSDPRLVFQDSLVYSNKKSVATNNDQSSDKIMKDGIKTLTKTQSILNELTTNDIKNSNVKESVSPGNNLDQNMNSDDYMDKRWDEECRQHLADFAEKLSEKLLAEIDRYREQSSIQPTSPVYIGDSSVMSELSDPYLCKLSEDLQDLTKLSIELQEKNEKDIKYMAEEKISINKCDLSYESSRIKGEGASSDEKHVEDESKSDSDLSEKSLSNCSIKKRVISDVKSYLQDDQITKEYLPEEQIPLLQEYCEENQNVIVIVPNLIEPLSDISSLNEANKRMATIVNQESTTDENKMKPDDPVPILYSDAVVKDGSIELSDPESTESEANWTDSRRNTILPTGKGLLTRPPTGVHMQVEASNQHPKEEVTKIELLPAKDMPRRPSISIEMSEPFEIQVKEKDETVVENMQLHLGISLESSEAGDISERTGSSSEGSRPSSRRETIQISDSGSVLSLRPGLSIESSEAGDYSDKAGSDGSRDSRRDTVSFGDITSSSQNSLLRPGNSIESSDAGDVSDRTGSDFSRQNTSSAGKTPSTASFASDKASDCSKDARFADRRMARCDGRSSSEEMPLPRSCMNKLVRQRASTQEPSELLAKAQSCETSLSGSTSQDSLLSDSGGGAITFHRYYHVFREGELDQLIERYVENLHIISSYYDHANWCVVAEKVQVWTI